MDNPYPNPTHDWFYTLDETDVAEALAHAKILMQLDEHESVLVRYYTNGGRKPLTNQDRVHLAESRLVDVLSLILDGSIVGTTHFETAPPEVSIRDVAWLIVQQEKDDEQYYEDQRLTRGDEDE